jgi:hypothetical protein
VITQEPDGPYTQYRSKRGTRTLWAKRMPADFSIRVDRGVVDQRKAGARAKVQYVALLEGTAGDYLVIPDLATGTRTVYSGPEFDAAFAPIPEARSGTRSPP